MRNQKNARCRLSGREKYGRYNECCSCGRSVRKIMRLIIAFSLIVTIFLTGAGMTGQTGPSCPNGPADPAEQGIRAVYAVSAEAAVRHAEKAAFADEEEPVWRKAEKKTSSDKSIWDKLKEKLPDIDMPDIDMPDIHLPDVDFFDFDEKTEKEKFREAIRKMDEMGISPEKLVERAWKLLEREGKRK